jgi:hypothetical protein
MASRTEPLGNTDQVESVGTGSRGCCRGEAEVDLVKTLTFGGCYKKPPFGHQMLPLRYRVHKLRRTHCGELTQRFRNSSAGREAGIASSHSD